MPFVPTALARCNTYLETGPTTRKKLARAYKRRQQDYINGRRAPPFTLARRPIRPGQGLRREELGDDARGEKPGAPGPGV